MKTSTTLALALALALSLAACGDRTLSPSADDGGATPDTELAPDATAPAPDSGPASPDALAAPDLPAFTDAGAPTPDVAQMPMVPPPKTGDLSTAKAITELSAEKVLWAHEGVGGGKYPEVVAWIKSARAGRLVALVETQEPLTIAGTTLGSAGLTAQNLREVHAVEIDKSGVTRWVTFLRARSPRCHHVVAVDDELLVSCDSSDTFTVLPLSPAARTFTVAKNQNAGGLVRFGFDGTLRFARLVEGVQINGVRADPGRDIALFGTFYDHVSLAASAAPLLMRIKPPNKGFYTGSGFMLRFDRNTGAILAASQIDGDASSAIGDVLLRADGSALVCGTAGGYSSSGSAIATFNPGRASELSFLSFSGGDPSAVAFLARFERKADGRDEATWVRGGYGYLDTQGFCRLAAISSSHVAINVNGGSTLAWSGGPTLLGTSGSPIVIYQDNGVPVGGASVAVTLSDNKYVYGAGANLIGPGSAHILMVSGRELYFDAYSAAPRVLSFPAPPTTERHGYLNVVADIDWQARLLALRWGLQPVVSSTQSAPTFVRFARTSTDEGALAGSFYGVMRFGGAQVTVGSAKERRLFFVASRLARGVL